MLPFTSTKLLFAMMNPKQEFAVNTAGLVIIRNNAAEGWAVYKITGVLFCIVCNCRFTDLATSCIDFLQRLFDK